MNKTHQEDVSVFGFWVYLMTDVVLFATLFATYAVLHNNTFGGVNSVEIFKLPPVLLETMILLSSSFTCGLAMLAMQRRNKGETVMWLTITLLLGLTFLGMEVSEFRNLVVEGHGPSQSAFLSSFFTLVGTHGLHIATGSIAMIVMLKKLWAQGFTESMVRRLTSLSLFWHFLDIVWIFIFSLVYLMGVIR